MKRNTHGPRARMTGVPGRASGPHQAISYEQASAPEMRLAADISRAYQDETDQDRRSLERVFARLQQDHIPAEQRSNALSEVAYDGERISSMHDTIGQWKRRIALLAATLCLLVLVAGFVALAGARVTRNTVVGSQITRTLTPRSSVSAVSSAIRRALLCASPIGRGEGVGPGLSGLIPADHFQVGHQFWLFFLVNATHSGTVSARWYADGLLSHTSGSYIPAFPETFPAGTALPTPASNAPVEMSAPIESNFSITYSRPASGRVELYWNGQLCLTLFFVVQR